MKVLPMLRYMLCASVMAAISAPSFAACDSAFVTETAGPYIQCALNRGLALERSKESPGDIATAAIAFCTDDKQSSINALSACLAPELMPSIGERLEQTARKTVIARIVEKRAAIPR